MSETSQDPTDLFGDDAAAAPKKAAKKSTARKTAKKAAKKTTAKKAVKKAAKKAVKKTTAKKTSAKKAAKKARTEQAVAPEASAKDSAATEASAPVAPEASKTEAPREAASAEASPEKLEKAEKSNPKAGRVRVRDCRSEEAKAESRQASEVSDAEKAAAAAELAQFQDEPANKQDRNKRGRNRRGRNRRGGDSQNGGEPKERKPLGPPAACDGLLEVAPKGFGFLRRPEKDFAQIREDVFVSPDIIRKHGLREGMWVKGMSQDGPRGPQLTELNSINGMSPEEVLKLPHFDELKAVNPNRRISFETKQDTYTTRVVDMMAPVGRGQRGLLVAPPRSGKTTVLQHMAEAVQDKYEDDIHLMILLIDERPEEVTEFRRCLPDAEIYASSNDSRVQAHTRIAELAIARAKRLVEAGKDVFLLMDSITRLARAYNNSSKGKGRTMSGGIDARALEMPRKLFAAARNTRNAGSLTIIATALVHTNSRMDDLIFQEFKGTGNMEFVLDRRIAEHYIYPAADIFKSGTRREELLLPENQLEKISLIRRGLAGHRPTEAMERLLFFLKKYHSNAQMLLDIKPAK